MALGALAAEDLACSMTGFAFGLRYGGHEGCCGGWMGVIVAIWLVVRNVFMEMS